MQNRTPNIKHLILFLFLIPAVSISQISPHEAIIQMKMGINLGNTLEPPKEGDWGNPLTQEYFFDMYKKEGFNFVRVPVRWDNHMSRTSPYQIEEVWLKRVEQILDWGLSKGLFMVVNSHHDEWIKTGYADPVNRARFDSLWSQVAVRFKDKSEKLIFEVANEPVNMTKEQNDAMHKSAINVIRKTNPTRLIIFQGIDWGGSDALIKAAIPDDKFIIGSFHSYDPYLFGLEGQGKWGTSSDINAMKSKFQAVKDWSVKNNIPVFLGEFGSIKTADYNSRMKHYKTYVELSSSFGFAPAAWDDGGNFRIMNRAGKSWDFDIMDILTHSSQNSPRMPRLALIQDTIIKLDWSNPASDYDSIYIEQRSLTSIYKRIATLPGNAITFRDTNLTQNRDYYYRVVAHYVNDSNLYSYPQKIYLPVYVPKEPPVRKFYTGQALPVPGIIQAENFDIGGEGYTYHDSDSKNITGELRPDEGIDIYNLGNDKYLVADNFPGEWLEYTVNVAEKGEYSVTAYIAAFAGGGTFTVSVGNSESDTIKAPTTYSWINTKSVSFKMNLEAGTQVLRINIIDKPLFNIDYLDISRNIATSVIPEKKSESISIRQTNQEIIIHSANVPIDQFKLFSISGNLIKTINRPGTDLKVSTQDLHSGIYILQLISGNKKTSKKIAIN
ncbi:MAG: cellulase family glycosylhydrolase [Prolixibacteraceae bacterium]